MSEDPLVTVDRFQDALNRHDLDAVSALLTDDAVFEATSPAPDGTRYEGREAFLGACREFFAQSPNASFDHEVTFSLGERVIVRWRYAWADGHVRGVDVLRVRDGQVAESLAYVKG
jgi:ketosteroid isomerase-like protein